MIYIVACILDYILLKISKYYFVVVFDFKRNIFLSFKTDSIYFRFCK